jgi:ribonuclease HI
VIAEIWCDGAAKKKSKATTVKKKLVRGPAGARYVIELEDGTREIHSEPLGNKTNNEAEYEAILRAPTLTRDLGSTHAHVRSDSRPVIGQIAWGWHCDPSHLRALRNKVFALVREFPHGVSFVQIPREENKSGRPRGQEGVGRISVSAVVIGCR